ncbi:hypothetical protein SASPL_114705 [Salvia splendens]|uniref:Choline transporter-like protein n=1 Tax=Salvia splendens TaxID=180675 RepID=A0A8X8Y152_SALSN|nr:protein PNS1-like [Salvia splendens]KAG6424290.1 hypothetical protein SASPL_114705 [Salvia splendens]
MQIQERNGPPFEKRERNLLSNMFKYIFCIQFLLIVILELYLIVRGVISASDSHRFHPKKWYLPLLSSTACAGIAGFAWQLLTSINPSRAFKAAFVISPLVTCAYGILLVSIGSKGSAAAAVFALASAVIQSLYACWVHSRFQHATRILVLSVASSPPRIRTAAPLLIFICTFYSAFLLCGIGGATAIGTNKLNVLFIFLTLLSLTWTLHVARNMMFITVSHIKFMRFASGTEAELKTVIRDSAMNSIGRVCFGSILVPVLGVIRGLARATGLLTGDVDEFMFSCANCCTGVAKRFVVYGNRWGFVHVAVYNKGIVQASKDTWEIFNRTGIEMLIDTDLTSSFCFLCGIAAGSLCALVAGTWALFVQKSYATELSLYAFLTGYLLNRVAMAWIQASVAAYYVAYAENPQNQQFDGTIPDYIQALQRLQR